VATRSWSITLPRQQARRKSGPKTGHDRPPPRRSLGFFIHFTNRSTLPGPQMNDNRNIVLILPLHHHFESNNESRVTDLRKMIGSTLIPRFLGAYWLEESRLKIDPHNKMVSGVGHPPPGSFHRDFSPIPIDCT